MNVPIAFTGLLRQIATAITFEAQHAGMSRDQADDLMARVLKRLGVDEQTIAEQRRKAIEGTDTPTE